MTEAGMSDGTLEQNLQSVHGASFGWALACCNWNREEAEEVLQTSYLKALERRARFDGRSTLRTWFFGVIKHTAAEQRRRRQTRALMLLNWFKRRPEPTPPDSPERLSHETQLQTRLHHLLSRLSQRQKEVLHLVFYQELTIDEASVVLGISLGSARTHYERGKSRMRELLMSVGESDERSTRRTTPEVI
jgi:RNA polymerase sigma factor (sigma-70 family)